MGFELMPGDPQRGRASLLSSAGDFELRAEVYRSYDLPNLRSGSLRSAEHLYQGLGETNGLQ